MSPGVLLRLIRFQFLPVILSPVIVGTALAWWANKAFSPFIFTLVALGSALLHLGANTIDDAYDYQSGVDVASNSMFPPDFGGWKPLPRKMMTLGEVKGLAYAFFLLALAIGLYLTYATGPLVFVLGAVGAFFGFFHVAPPLRLGYRGLGEAGIAVSFGLLPAIGSFFVQTRYVSLGSVLAGIPLGLLTATILMNHDQIFYGPYQQSGKKSLTVILGRRASMNLSLLLTVVSYLIVLLAIPFGLLPWPSAIVLISLPLFARQVQLYRSVAASPLHYVKLTMTTFLLSVSFGILLALGLVVA